MVSGAVPMVIDGKREFKGVRSRRGRMFERCKKSSAARRRGDMMTRLTVGGVSRGSEEARCARSEGAYASGDVGGAVDISGGDGSRAPATECELHDVGEAHAGVVGGGAAA